MIRRVIVSLLLCSASTAVAAITPAEGVRCDLTGGAKLFLAKDGTKFSTELNPGDSVTLKVAHDSRWMVQTSSGKLGFLAKTTMASICRYLPALVEKREEVQAAPNLEAYDITITAAALDATKAAAEGIAIDKEVIQEQVAQVTKAAEERDQARAEEGRAAPDALIRVAVYDLELTNIPKGLGSATTEALLQEVRKLEGVSAIGMAEVREMLDFEAERQAMGCDADDACLAEIAGALGVDEILTGKLSEQADGRMIVLKRIDQRRAEIRTSYDKRLQVGNGEEFLLTVGNAIQTLFAERQIRPGTKRGVSEKTVLRLNPPPVKRWMTLSTFGVSAASFGTAGLLQYLAFQNNQEFTSVPDGFSKEEPPQSQSYIDLQSQGQSYEQGAQVALISGGITLLSGVVMSLFTDWMDHGEGDSEE